MDNTVGFYPTNVGSIPACRTSCWAGSLMVKQSTHNRLSGSSILSLPTICPDGQIGKVVSLKRRNVVSSNLTRGTKLCGCEAEWLGYGLQIRFMQVRSLSPTPK